jgi:putative ABC transport system permease protein
MLTESLVLAGAATALGLGIAFVGPTFLLRLFAADSLSTQPIPDLRVFGYATVVAVTTCLAFGLAPALHAAGGLGDSLKGRYGLASASFSLRHLFLAIQVAVSVVVLCGSGFLMRGVGVATRQTFGFNWAGVSTIAINLPASQDSTTTANFARDITGAIARRPDARLIGATAILPFTDRNQTLVLKPGQDSASAAAIFTLAVSGEYFNVLEIPILSGRSIMPSDVGTGAIVINEAAADRLWPRQNPIGQTLTIRTPRQVVGVVRNADTEAKAAQEGSVLAKIYEPVAGAGSTTLPKYVVRGASPQTLREISDLARGLAPAVRVTTQSLAESLDNQLSDLRSDAMIVAILGGVSLILVSIGIFGVFAYVVQQRTREIGIRIALGARSADVIRVVVGSSLRPIMIGLGVGLFGAVAESFVVRGFVYGVSPFDPVTYAMIVVILGAAAVVAVYLPARRASRIVPIVALRVD